MQAVKERKKINTKNNISSNILLPVQYEKNYYFNWLLKSLMRNTNLKYLFLIHKINSKYFKIKF